MFEKLNQDFSNGQQGAAFCVTNKKSDSVHMYEILACAPVIYDFSKTFSMTLWSDLLV